MCTTSPTWSLLQEDKKRKQVERDKLEKERRAKEDALRQREELELRLRKFEAQARKANDKLVSV